MLGQQGGPSQEAPPPAVPVTVAVSMQKDVPVPLDAIGTVRRFATVSVKTCVDVQLAKVGFKEGDEVKKGDLIFSIDPRPFQAELSKAEAMLARDRASLQNAEAEMRRTDELVGTKAVAASLVDENRSKVPRSRRLSQRTKRPSRARNCSLSIVRFVHPWTDASAGSS